MNRLMDGWMNEQKDGQIDRLMDGWMDEWVHIQWRTQFVNEVIEL